MLLQMKFIYLVTSKYAGDVHYQNVLSVQTCPNLVETNLILAPHSNAWILSIVLVLAIVHQH